MSEQCQGCGDSHAPRETCDHQHAELNQCHTTVWIACPHHFSFWNQRLLAAALPQGGHGGSGARFDDAVEHLNSDRMIISSWYVWMGLLGRYLVPVGPERDAVLRQMEPVDVPQDAPLYVRRAAPLVSWSLRAAIAGDHLNADALLDTLQRTEDIETVLCVLKSLAASAHMAVDGAAHVNLHHVEACLLLGSQVVDGWGMRVLPILAEMVVSHRNDGGNLVPGLMDELCAMPGVEALVTSVGIVTRTLAQTTANDVTVLVGSGVPGTPETEYEGLVDVNNATPSNTSRAVMAGVWGLRAARGVTAASDGDQATAMLQDLVRQHGDPFQFSVDVILAGTQMIAYAAAAADAAAAGHGPDSTADFPPGPGVN